MLLFIFIREEYLTEEANFNTSHVTVYQKDWTAKVADSTISIHLMLLFIFSLCCFINSIKIFQYISCYCLSYLSFLDAISLYNFNTSHVTVYLEEWSEKGDYIQISIHLMLLFIEMSVKHAIRFPNFNTSHVTVYRSDWCSGSYSCIFQYISCYCLSRTFLIHLLCMLDFNTSHVTVYLSFQYNGQSL